MAIEELLKKNGQGVTTIESATSVYEAVWLMRQTGASALIVSDNGHDLLGLVSGHELIRALKSHGVNPLMPKTVADIMQPGVLTCDPGESLRLAMKRMTARGFAHIAVVSDRGLCGVVSLAEIIKGRLKWARMEIGQSAGTAH